jgi:hypothetical protein
VGDNGRGDSRDAGRVVPKPRKVLPVQVVSGLTQQQDISLHGDSTGKGQLIFQPTEMDSIGSQYTISLKPSYSSMAITLVVTITSNQRQEHGIVLGLSLASS